MGNCNTPGAEIPQVIDQSKLKPGFCKGVECIRDPGFTYAGTGVVSVNQVIFIELVAVTRRELGATIVRMEAFTAARK